MRLTGPEIQQGFTEGVRSGGVSIIDLGLTSTDQLWFASGVLGLPGVQITSSHNGWEYNGMKFCLAGAKPVTGAFLGELADRARRIDAEGAGLASTSPGDLEHRDLLADYVHYLLSLVDLEGIRRLRVVVDAGNGMAGLTAPAVFAQINAELIGLYLDLDGAFPNHQPNPLDPANLVAAQQAVRDTQADLAIVFDGDADRAFVIDETGAVVSPSAVTALIAVDELALEPGSAIVVNSITSSAVREVVAEHGGVVVESKVGHTYMKALMASHHAIFGGEHSAHYYFRDFFGADTGMLAALHVIAVLGHGQRPLSELVRDFTRYVASGEINSTIHDQIGAMESVAAALGGGDVTLSWEDGLRISADDWWISLRPSNTEPLLRLNVEAREATQMAQIRDSVLSLLKEERWG
jgi:phosphomannomutase